MILNLVCDTVSLFCTVRRNNTVWSEVCFWLFPATRRLKIQMVTSSFFSAYCMIIFCAVFLGCVSQNIHQGALKQKLYMVSPTVQGLIRNHCLFRRESLPTIQGLFQMMQCSARWGKLSRTVKLHHMESHYICSSSSLCRRLTGFEWFIATFSEASTHYLTLIFLSTTVPDKKETLGQHTPLNKVMARLEVGLGGAKEEDDYSCVCTPKQNYRLRKVYNNLLYLNFTSS